MSDLTIVCVTNAREHAEPFVRDFDRLAQRLGCRLVVAWDAPSGRPPAWLEPLVTCWRTSGGYIESVLDSVLEVCEDGYVLRLDDDERVTPEMEDWLAAGGYREAPHWAFPRMNLWPDAGRYIVNAPLWPDLQTRLSVKELAGGLRRVHAGSPHGTGRVAPVAIEHHKFLVRSRQERQELMEHYERLQKGAGYGYAMFSVPELYGDDIEIAPVPGAAAAIVARAMARGAAQKPGELLRLVEFIRERERPRTVLEIGTMLGGTLSAWCELAADDALIVSVDLPGGRWGGENVPAGHEDTLRAFARTGQRLELVRADSHDPATQRRVAELAPTVDLLFIDGDHTYEGVKADYDAYAPLVRPGGLIVLHDVLPHPLVPGCQVDRLWKELVRAGDARAWEFSLPDERHRDYGQWGGIGVLEVPA